MIALLVFALQAPSVPEPFVERLAYTHEVGTAMTRFQFSPDGTRLGVHLHDGKSPQLILDGEAVDKGHDYFAGPLFSSDGKHVAWAHGDRKGKKEKWQVILNDKKVGSYDWAGNLALSDNGTLAFWSGKGVKLSNEGWYTGGKYTLMVGKKKSGETRQAPDSPPLLSNRGKLIGYTALDQGYLIYLGKEELGPYMWVSGMTATPDGKAVAWTATSMPDGSGDMGFGGMAPSGSGMPRFRGEAYLDGEVVSGNEDEACASPALSNDGRKLAYITQRNDKVSVVVSGETWKVRAGSASSPVFSPDGKKVAVVLDHGTATATMGMPDLNTRWLDGMNEAAMDASGAWVLRKPDGECFLYVDGVKSIGPFKRAVLPVWSPDSEQLALRVQTDDGWKMVVGKTESPTFTSVGKPVFSPDGSKVAFGAQDGQEVWWKVMELPKKE
jgi:hypothetical protein